MRPEIIRVWGVADGFDISFDKRDGSWIAAVPTDLSDGQYAVEIHALNEYRLTAIWSGILYMHAGRACIHLIKQKYTFWFYEPTKIVPKYGRDITRHSIIFKGVCSVD